MGLIIEFPVMLFGALILYGVCVSSESSTSPLPSKESCPNPSEEKEPPVESCSFEDDLYKKYSDKYDREDDIPDKPELLENPNRICEPKSRCGFLKYDEKTRRPQEPFVKYCQCPEDLACVRVGENRRRLFFYYKCAILTGFEKGWDIGDASSLGIYSEEPDDVVTDLGEDIDEPTGIHMDTETFQEKLEELARGKVNE